MKDNPIYLGNGEEKFDGDLVSFSLNLTKLKECGEHIFEIEGTKYIKLDVCRKREVDEYGKTHYVKVNTFKPQEKRVAEKVDDDIPF